MNKKIHIKPFKYHIGQCLLFIDDNDEICVGEVVSITITKNNQPIYKMRAASNDCWEEYPTVTEDRFVQAPPSLRPPHDVWTIEHMTDINTVFGKDMNDYVMIIYDSLEDAEQDFDDLAHETKYCRQVLDKWVMVIG